MKKYPDCLQLKCLELLCSQGMAPSTTHLVWPLERAFAGVVPGLPVCGGRHLHNPIRPEAMSCVMASFAYITHGSVSCSRSVELARVLLFCCC